MNKLVIATSTGPRAALIAPHAQLLGQALQFEVDHLDLVHGDDRKTSIEPSQPVVLRAPGEKLAESIVRAADERGAAMIAMYSEVPSALRHAVQGSDALKVLSQAPCPVLLAGPRIMAEPPKPGSACHLVIASDSNATSDVTIDALAPLLEGADIQTTLLTVFELELGALPEEQQREACAERLDALRQQLPDSIPCETVVADAGPFEPVPNAIVRASLEQGATTIAMATRGHETLRHLVSGSIALAVLRRSPLPVILVRAA